MDDASFVSPKSLTLAMLSSETNTFLAARSRWTKLLASRYSMASQTSLAGDREALGIWLPELWLQKATGAHQPCGWGHQGSEFSAALLEAGGFNDTSLPTSTISGDSISPIPPLLFPFLKPQGMG